MAEGDAQQIEIADYVFDPEFSEITDVDDPSDNRVAIFRLVSDRLPTLFIRLANSHNGYYSHGFAFKGSRIIEGTL